MSTTLLSSIDDIQTYVKDSKKVHIAGNGTKTALLNLALDVTTLSLSGLTGITEYQPEEYTITAYAGTSVQEIQVELSKNGQYLPFDPMLAKTASIGGTVATNLSGSRRFRYGGVRDFILGTTVVDGRGQTFRCGAKVVKNSAGFDLAKFFVGSLGKYAIMTELTFKVFPDAPIFTTMKLQFGSLDNLLSAVYYLNQSAFELDALNFEPDGDQWVMLVRVTGRAESLSARVERFLNTLKHQTALLESSELGDDMTVWNTFNDLSAGDSRNVVKVVFSPKQIPAFDADIHTSVSKRWYSVGGNVAWVATDDLTTLHKTLTKYHLTGLAILGNSDSVILGKPINNVLSDRVKQILDPDNKFV